MHTNRNRLRNPFVIRLILSVLLAAMLTLAAPVVAQTSEQRSGLEDSEITDAVENELLFDPAVPLNDIEVVTTDGIVVLSGTVSNLLARDRAIRLAETVRGVRSVASRIKVSPRKSRTDTTLESDVVQAMVYDPAVDFANLDVEVDDGVVILSGTVNSWQEKTLAIRTAKGVRGVAEVRDRMDIQFVEDRTDSEILPEVKQALRWDALVDDALIDVSVDDGVVTLKGTVGSAAEKRRAEYDAQIAGVRDVSVDRLEVARWARDSELRKGKYQVRSAEEIEEAMERAFDFHPRLKPFDVQPEIAGSTVTLRGKVGTIKAKRAAGRIARATTGISAVTNRLKIRGGEELTEAEIAGNVRKALRRNPYVERFEITISVIGSTVYLYGTVDSYFEKGQADDAASMARGVTKVRNDLDVESAARPIAYEPYLDDDYLYTAEWYDYEPHWSFQDDSEIESSIRDELWWSPYVTASDVSVEVDKGTARLTGKVNTPSEREAAVQNAYEGGALWVIDKLKIRGRGEEK